MQKIFSSHWKHIENIIKIYNGQNSLSEFLKNYFKNNKNCGSNDRKIISNYCYTFYRLDNLYLEKSIIEKINLGLEFIYNINNNLIPDINKNLDIQKFIKFDYLISNKINLLNYAISFLKPPTFFIRILKNNNLIKNILKENNTNYNEIEDNILQFNSNQNITNILAKFESDFYIQDFSCQKILDYINLKDDFKIWDCCCGSGGKTILLKSYKNNIKIWNCDIRKSIIVNLNKRLKQHNIISEKIFIADLEKHENKNIPLMDIIIADVPCSGSGTWKNTPENKYFFNANIIDSYVIKQQNIIKNILPNLKKGGKLIYITCSVFFNENENQIKYFIENHNLILENETYIINNEYNSDTIFLAILTLK